MLLRYIKSKSGFTAAELIVSFVIMLLITVAATSFYVLAKRICLHAYVQGELHRVGIQAMEKMIHGPDVGSHKGIQDAQEIVNFAAGATSSQITFKEYSEDPTPPVRKFELVGNDLVYTSDAGATDLITGDVTYLAFTRLENTAANHNAIGIDLELTRNIQGTDITVYLSTVVGARNTMRIK